jgi:hypothetical protein
MHALTRRYNIVASANNLGRSGNLNNHWLFANLHALALTVHTVPVTLEAHSCRGGCGLLSNAPHAFGHGSSPTVALAVKNPREKVHHLEDFVRLKSNDRGPIDDRQTGPIYDVSDMKST